MQKSVTKRIRVTKNGKLKRRAVALGHNKTNKTKTQKLRKRKARGFALKDKTLKKYL